ncbi:MAG TPA: phosphatase PAP2 family protein [Polyangiaceae bacterium]|nr:phosphatase PAP2 family protein [Polyangiaceae bacterium]
MSSHRLHALCAGLVLAGACLTSPARADDALAWNPNWQKFGTVDYVATGVLGAASLGAYFFLNGPSQPRWTGGILLDNSVRDALRARSPTTLKNVRTASDVLAISSVAFTLGIDSLAIPVARGHADTAWQLEMMNGEAFAVSTLVTTVLFKEVGRARPSYADCQQNPNFDALCNSAPLSSFPSGHTNVVFTAAGLSCAHHTHLALWGSETADDLGCGFSLLLASATGALRIIGDRHYLSDVLVGGAIGFGVGYGMPTIFHYTRGPDNTAETASLGRLTTSAPLALAWSGTF